MKKYLLLAMLPGIFLAQAQVHADENQRHVAESKVVVKEFMGKLKIELQTAVKAGGPLKAIEVCSKVAPDIAKAQSMQHGMKVARTSLKLRNQANAPDAWETRVLQSFEERKQKGEDVKKMAYFEVVKADGKQTFRFMKAIPTGKVCLSCHGEKIEPAVKAKLDKIYPDDKAIGFKLGDVRGAFTIQKSM